MFKKSAVIFSLVASAMATIFVTNPTASTTCTAGTPCNIAWQDDGAEPSLEEFANARVSVYAGNARQQTMLQPISDGVNVATTGGIVFNPDPAIGPDGGFYFIRFESLSARDPDNNAIPALAFSARFTLTGMRGEFNATVQAQVDGLTTAPLAGPTSSARTATTTSTGTTRTGTSTTGTSTSTTTAGATGANGASHIMASGAVAGVAGVVAAIVGFAL